MKRMTKQEFHDRHQAIVRAKKIYMPHFTKNLTLAFKMYQKVLAEHDRAIFIDKMSKRRSLVDGYIRPRCPQCDTDLMLFLINISKGRRNRHGYKTVWQCPVCDHEEYSTKTVDDWLQELKMEESTRKENEAYPWGCWKTIQ